MAVKLPLTVGQQERIGEITVLKAGRAAAFMTVMYSLLTGFVGLLLVWAIILTVMLFVRQLAACPQFHGRLWAHISLDRAASQQPLGF
jgi:hypothetical protein